MSGPPQEVTEQQKIARRVGVGLGVAAFVLSLLPERSKEILHTKGALHPWLHLAIFATLGTLAMLSSAKVSTRLFLLAGAMLLGLSIEYSEAIRFQSAFEFYDVVTDTSGVLIGTLFGWLLTRRAG